MRAGEIDTLATLESRTVSRDAFGGPVETWSTYALAWAAVTDQPSREFAAGRLLQTTAVRQTLVRLRYVAGVKPTMRIRFGGRTMNVVSVSEIGRHAGLELVCEDING